VHDPVNRSGAAALENRYFVKPKGLRRAGVISLVAQCLLAISWQNPLSGRAMVCRQQSGIDAVAVIFPTGIVPDAFQPHIYPIAFGDVGIDADKIVDIA